MPKIEIEIGGDNSDLKKKIKEVEFDVKELAKVKVDRIKLGLDTTEITAQIKDTKSTLTGLRGTLKDTGDSFTGMAPKVANGSNALMQFSRIAQDAPFGIMGIGNNITATTEAFGHLKQSTGSTGAALKAMASSLLGSGGILLAVSLVTTALTYMSMNGITVGDVVDKLTGNFDALKEATKKLAEASKEGQKEAVKETLQLQSLVAIAKNTTLSYEDRLIAVEKLQNLFPRHFGNLTNEQILNGNVENSIRAVTNAILARAKATAAEGKITENQSKVIDLEEELVLLKKTELALAKNVVNRNKIFEATGDAQVNTVLKQAESRYISASNAVKSKLKEINDLQTINNRLTSYAIENQTKSISLSEKGKSTKSGLVPNKTTFDTPQVAPIVNALVPAGLVPIIGAQLMAEIPAIKLATEAISAELMAFNEGVDQLIQGSLIDTFAGLGNALGEALATGGNVLSALGKSLLNSLGGFLSSLGKQMIAFGVTALFFDKTKKSLFSGVGTPAAAVGLIAAGVALSTIGSAIGSMASKGSGSGGASSNTGGNSYQSSGGSNGGFTSGSGGGTVVFRIAGQDLIGVLSNTLDKNSRLGGAIAI